MSKPPAIAPSFDSELAETGTVLEVELAAEEDDVALELEEALGEALEEDVVVVPAEVLEDADEVVDPTTGELMDIPTEVAVGQANWECVNILVVREA